MDLYFLSPIYRLIIFRPATWLQRSGIRTVAIRTFLRCRLVEQNQLSLDLPLQLVALFALKIGVAARQWKLCALVMVKCRWRPALVHVAVPAFSYTFLRCKLVAMRLCVARFAILRRSLELNVVSAGYRFMALAARHNSMGALQRKFCFRMVESAYVDPRARYVTRFATLRRAIGFFLGHAVFKLTLVGIGVAGGACAVLKMEGQNLICSPPQARLVALGTGNCHVSAGQGKM